ncbi:dna repair protein rad5 [Diplodia corticola]|uniref:Dna repair protein rad5 n=1 Tax=Diplodia corticola TaxID=236234 RepID=A0A1J9RSW6_9PEZI|nr:dna repair protein rad5 [Diplodia corticola]OJD35651.1 dna repair protein rad5 [Diplodia corticola]
MSDNPIKPDPDGGPFIDPPRASEAGASRETAIDVEQEEEPVTVKEEPRDDPDVSEAPTSKYRDLGHDKALPITIDDNDDDDDDGGDDHPRHDLPQDQMMAFHTGQEDQHNDPPEEPPRSPAAPQSPLAPISGPEAPIAPGDSIPLHLGNSLLSSPARKPKRRDLQQMRLLRKRLMSNVNNNGYNPVYNAPPVLDPLHDATPGPSDDAPAAEHERTPFEQARIEYEAKKANGTVTFEDEIMFIRTNREEDARTNQAAEDARFLADGGCMDVEEDGGGPQSDSDDGLFVPQVSPPPRRRGKRKSAWVRHAGLEDDGEDFPDVGEGPSSAMAREMGDAEEELREMLGEHLEGRRKKRAKRGEGRKRKTGNGRAQSPQQEASTNVAHTLGSLMQSNVFHDQAANQNAPYLPEITDTRKAEALKKLLASVPENQRKRAVTDKKELFKASRKFSHRAARPDGHGGWKITGMTTSLQNHQLIGGGFMRDRERGGVDDKPHGGICADAMGLGKTLEMIANIINERPKKLKAGERKATLIVLPATLVSQWYAELNRHVDPKQRLQILVWKAGHRIETPRPVETLSRFDIVLTTYYEVQKSYPKAETPIELQTSEEKNRWWKEHYEAEKGPLHRVEWRRVVLDEAQAIKNFRSRTSLACRALVSTYRWALSGTPILNSPLELYPYFKFLEVPYTGSFRVFKSNYYNDGGRQEPMERLSIMVSQFMIRRTHRDTLFGAPIVRLPKASDRVHWVHFNDLERAIYEIVHRRMVARVNSFARENTLQRNYRNVLTMLLRLRQMTGNVLLVEVVMKDLLEREDHEKIRELAEVEVAGDATRRAQLIALRKVLAKPPPPPDNEEDESEGTPAVQVPGSLDGVPDGDILTGGLHGLTFSFGKYLQDLRRGRDWEELKKRTLCVMCHQPPDSPYVTACYHIYCHECLEMAQHDSAAKGEAHCRCSECQCEYVWAQPCDEFDLDSIMSDVEDGEVSTSAPPTSRWRKRKRDKGKDEENIARSWIQKHGAVLPSAKTIAVKAQILNWLEQDPDAKILVYTQFISMIQIMKKVCQTEGWTFQEYTGQMAIAARDRALDQFKRNNTSILLASLKCGGLGLNLTAAKHVISIDPWWNSALEQQAFCRVFRIGQTEETSMTRFAVAGTIDEKLINMQVAKQEQIDRVMGDSGEPRENLTMHQMMRLFGPVKEDEQGRSFVIVEDRETLPRFNADSEDEGDED